MVARIGRFELVAALVVLFFHHMGLHHVPPLAGLVGIVGLLGTFIHPARLALVVVEAFGHGLGRFPILPQLAAVVDVTGLVAGQMLDVELSVGVFGNFPGGGAGGNEGKSECNLHLVGWFVRWLEKVKE